MDFSSLSPWKRYQTISEMELRSNDDEVEIVMPRFEQTTLKNRRPRITSFLRGEEHRTVYMKKTKTDGGCEKRIRYG